MKTLSPSFYILTIILGIIVVRVIFIGLRKLIRAMYEVDYEVLDYTITLIEGIINGKKTERRSWPFGGRYIIIEGLYNDKPVICEVVYGFIGILDEGPCPVLKMQVNKTEEKRRFHFQYTRPSRNTYLKDDWVIAEIYNYIFFDDLKMKIWPKKFNKENILRILGELHTTAKMIDNAHI